MAEPTKPETTSPGPTGPSKPDTPRTASGSTAASTTPHPAPTTPDRPAPSRDAATPAASSAPSASPTSAASSRAAPRSAPVASLIFGGALAAFLGFLAAWVWLDRPVDDSALAARIDDLEAEIAALPAAPEATDLGPVTEGQAALSSRIDDLAAQLEALGTTQADLDTRLVAVERAPTEGGAVSETAITSLERELAAVRADLDAQTARVEEVASGAAATLAANAEEAEAAEAAAAAEAQATEARAALAQVRAALDTGTPYAEPLATLATAGLSAPEALAAPAEAGVPTLAALQSGFPGAARAAVEAGRAEESDGGLLSFFDGMTQRRSVTPQEGDSVDAIQSRAEDALRRGALDAALTELDALPESAAAAFADWRAAAETRRAALAATDALAADIDTLSPQTP